MGEIVGDMDTISLENINIFSEWRLDYDPLIIEEALEWLEEEEEQHQVHGEREEKQEWG